MVLVIPNRLNPWRLHISQALCLQLNGSFKVLQP